MVCRSPFVLPEGRAFQVIRTLTSHMVLIIQLKAVLTAQCRFYPSASWRWPTRSLSPGQDSCPLVPLCPGQRGWSVGTAGCQLCRGLEAPLQACLNLCMRPVPSMHSFLSVHLLLFSMHDIFSVFFITGFSVLPSGAWVRRSYPGARSAL